MGSLLLLFLTAFFFDDSRVIQDVHNTDEIERLIKNLGDSEFRTRDLAAEKLIEIGAAALGPLEKNRYSGDSEVQFRTQRIIQRIRREVRDKQLESFLSSDDPENDYGLAGWQLFRETAGDNRSARRLFVDMHIRTPYSVKKIDADIDTRQIEVDRLLRGLNSYTDADSGEIYPITALTTALFLVFNPRSQRQKLELSLESERLLYSWLANKEFADELKSKDFKHIPIAYIHQLLDRSNLDTFNLTRVLDVAERFEVKDKMLETSLKIVEGENYLGPPTLRAIMILAKTNDTEYAELIARKLDSDTLVFSRRQNNREIYTVQVGDVALAALIHLAKESPRDYGFKEYPEVDQGVGEYTQAGFTSDEERSDAKNKWMQRTGESNKPEGPDD